MSTQTAQVLTAAVKDIYSNTIIGFTLATTLYGITVLQTFLYYRSFFGKDRWPLKCLVCLLWVLDTIGTVLVAASLHTYLVSGIGKDVFQVTIVPLTFATENGVTTSIIFLAQIFFIYQIWTVSGSAFLTVPLGALSVASFVLGIIDAHKIFSNPQLSALLIPSDNVGLIPVFIETTTNFQIIRAIIKGITALDDILLAALLAYYRSSNRNGIGGTETIGDKIIKYAAGRATVATLIQIIYFVTYAACPEQTYWLPVHLLLPKVYINSVLASLNFRTILQDANELAYTLSALRSSGVTRVNLHLDDCTRNDVEIVGSREIEHSSETEERNPEDVVSAEQKAHNYDSQVC